MDTKHCKNCIWHKSYNEAKSSAKHLYDKESLRMSDHKKLYDEIFELIEKHGAL